jgi:hypothetical protein
LDPLVCTKWKDSLDSHSFTLINVNIYCGCNFSVFVYEFNREWRKLRNKELNDLYTSSNIFRVIKSRRIKLTGHVACMGERRGVYRVLVGKSERKKSLGRPRHRWEYHDRSLRSEIWGH